MNIDDVLDSRSLEINELFSAIRIGGNKVFNYRQLRKPTLLGKTFQTNKEVCKMLGLGLRTLQDYRERGHLAYYKIEGKILYKRCRMYYKCLKTTILMYGKKSQSYRKYSAVFCIVKNR
ncbi:MAG: helix-turn-helix domain-containing protein [Mediterranea sp.]|jgi:hypothetical protein|nr:helix-turn-helix domain-containing protein [Mediterranea sp.]